MDVYTIYLFFKTNDYEKFSLTSLTPPSNPSQISEITNTESYLQCIERE